MARSFEQELKAIEDDERKLAARRKALTERESRQMAKIIEKAGLTQLEPERLDAFMTRVKVMGFEEAERRLAA